MPRGALVLVLLVPLAAALPSCLQGGSFEVSRGRVGECTPFPRSDDLDEVGCDEAAAETWRCALSAGNWTDAEGEPIAISQVCRRTGDGWAWRTYTLFPQDCGACEGHDPAIPDGCEPSGIDRRWYVLPECAPADSDSGSDSDSDSDAGSDSDADSDSDAPAAAPNAAPGAPSPGVVAEDGVAAFDALPAPTRAALLTRHLFWGHQSVGENLIEGSEALGYDWSEVSGGSDYDFATWGHAPVEDNGDPTRKIRSFEALLDDAGIGDRVDAAAFKFCWIDFEPDTDVAALLASYQATLDDLATRFPAVRFLHVTPPLTSDDAERNAVRWDYGRRLIAAESDTRVVLDLAAIESTDSAGHTCTLGGVPRLCDEWRSDEGHLDEAGRARAARAFLYAFSRLF